MTLEKSQTETLQDINCNLASIATSLMAMQMDLHEYAQSWYSSPEDFEKEMEDIEWVNPETK